MTVHEWPKPCVNLDKVHLRMVKSHRAFIKFGFLTRPASTRYQGPRKMYPWKSFSLEPPTYGILLFMNGQARPELTSTISTQSSAQGDISLLSFCNWVAHESESRREKDFKLILSFFFLRPQFSLSLSLSLFHSLSLSLSLFLSLSIFPSLSLSLSLS